MPIRVFCSERRELVVDAAGEGAGAPAVPIRVFCSERRATPTIRRRWTPGPSSGWSRRTTASAGPCRVTPGICAGGSMSFMFGGAGLGASIAALEGTSGRETIWATAQYLSFARPGEVVDVDVTLAVEGHQMTQARAVCHVEDREILTVNAALGDRPFDREAQFETMPADVPRPEECAAARVPSRRGRQHRQQRLEQRLAKGRSPVRPRRHAGRRPDPAVGAHPRGAPTASTAHALAVLGDFVPMGVGPGARHPRWRQQPRQHAAHRPRWCRPTGCCSTSASTRSSEGSDTGSCTCSPRTGRCWRRPARAASCGTGGRRDWKRQGGRPDRP